MIDEVRVKIFQVWIDFALQCTHLLMDELYRNVSVVWDRVPRCCEGIVEFGLEDILRSDMEEVAEGAATAFGVLLMHHYDGNALPHCPTHELGGLLVVEGVQIHVE